MRVRPTQDDYKEPNDMMQRLVHAKNVIPCVLAATTGIILYFRMPFPADNFLIELLFLRARPLFLGLRYCYFVFLYTTPFIVYSILLTGIYIFALKSTQKTRTGRVPVYIDPSARENLFLVVGGVP